MRIYLGKKGLANPRETILLLLPREFSALLLFLEGASGCYFLSKQKKFISPHTHHEFPTEMRYPQVSNIFISATLYYGFHLEKNELVNSYEKQLKI